jgi:hypothetical protein
MAYLGPRRDLELSQLATPHALKCLREVFEPKDPADTLQTGRPDHRTLLPSEASSTGRLRAAGGRGRFGRGITCCVSQVSIVGTQPMVVVHRSVVLHMIVYCGRVWTTTKDLASQIVCPRPLRIVRLGYEAVHIS